MIKKIWTYVVGALCIASGILLIFNPGQSLSNLVYYAGLLLLVTGIIKLLSSIFSKTYFVPGSVFLPGIWNIIFGSILMKNSYFTLTMIPTFIGVWLIVTALSGLMMMFGFRKVHLSTRLLVEYILKLILGIIVMVTPLVSIIFSGAILGIILVAIGIGVISSYRDTDTKVYRVKVK